MQQHAHSKSDKAPEVSRGRLNLLSLLFGLFMLAAMGYAFWINSF